MHFESKQINETKEKGGIIEGGKPKPRNRIGILVFVILYVPMPTFLKLTRPLFLNGLLRVPG